LLLGAWLASYDGCAHTKATRVGIAASVSVAQAGRWLEAKRVQQNVATKRADVFNRAKLADTVVSE